MNEEYPGYIQHRSNLIYILALLCGFTFTATTILITGIPNPSSLPAQMTLLFSAILLDLFVFLLLLNTVNIFFYIRNIPLPTKTTNFVSLMSVVSIGLWGFLLPLIFSLFNLRLLALLCAGLWAFVLAVGIVVIWRPFEQRRRKGPENDPGS